MACNASRKMYRRVAGMVAISVTIFVEASVDSLRWVQLDILEK